MIYFTPHFVVSLVLMTCLGIVSFNIVIRT